MNRTWICVFCAAAGSTMLAAVGVAAPIDCANIATSTGPVPPELVAACGSQAVEGHHPRFAPTDLAVSPDAALTQCSSMVLNDPANPADFGTLAFRPACDFAGSDYSKLFCYSFDVPGVLSWVDPATCAETVVGTGSNSKAASGMAWDESTGTMYLSGSDGSVSVLYTVNLETGASSFVGAMNSASRANLALAALDGQLYGFDVLNDSLQSINKTTGIATTIGPLGFDANFAQGMDCDESDGTCYIFAFNNSTFAAELRTCDVSTGATTLVGPIGDGVDLREWTGAGVMTVPPPAGPCADPPLYCFDFDNLCDALEICQVLGDRTVVAAWDLSACGPAKQPMLGGYSGKNVSPRLSWLGAGDLSATLDVFSFNLNVDNRTIDVFYHYAFNGGFLLDQIQEDQPYTVTPGACAFGPEKAGLPSSTGVER